MGSQNVTRRNQPAYEVDQEDRRMFGHSNPQNHRDAVPQNVYVGRARGLENYNFFGTEAMSDTQQVPSWKHDINSASTSTKSQSAYTLSTVRKVNIDETTVTEKLESGLQVTTFKKGPSRSRKRPRTNEEGVTIKPGVTKMCTGEERERLDRNNAHRKKLNAVKQIKKQIKRLMDCSCTPGDDMFSMASIYRNGKEYSYLGFSDVYDDFRTTFTQYIERKQQAGTRSTIRDLDDGNELIISSQTDIEHASAQKSSSFLTPSGKLKYIVCML